MTIHTVKKANRLANRQTQSPDSVIDASLAKETDCRRFLALLPGISYNQLFQKQNIGGSFVTIYPIEK
ncbi:hypothetical protein KEF85_02590 [Methylomonas paludis]|uniref:Uncharacterized protein n=1 Tax=Methylomonas paludis TaxID=1173101 RepID=A0A975MP08_9GAMM|nr:hypothetical protein [Methylomonas paludis]QWF71393.1 hypothetical protein KEF85_02590 [Methylomonas paludis]